MKVTFEFRTGKPDNSGDYMVAMWGLRDQPYLIGNCEYNAETGRWNDGNGTGDYAVEVDMWAYIPCMRKEENDD